jgi:hypothetical protein
MKPSNECGACGLDFTSLTAFDVHRVGKHGYSYSEGVKMDPMREDGRRCRTPDELKALGMTQNAAGRWSLPGPDQNARDRSWGGRKSKERHV